MNRTYGHDLWEKIFMAPVHYNSTWTVHRDFWSWGRHSSVESIPDFGVDNNTPSQYRGVTGSCVKRSEASVELDPLSVPLLRTCVASSTFPWLTHGSGEWHLSSSDKTKFPLATHSYILLPGTMTRTWVLKKWAMRALSLSLSAPPWTPRGCCWISNELHKATGTSLKYFLCLWMHSF